MATEGALVIILSILAFLGGVTIKGRFNKRQEIKRKTEEADKVTAEGIQDADQQYEEDIAAVRAEAQEILADSPNTGDAAADLAYRIRRRKRRKRRRPRKS